jgi:hypothetical protein
MIMRALLLLAVLAPCLSSPSPPPKDDPLADMSDPQTLSQLLQWSLANQDLDALHAKAEAIRRGGEAAGASPNTAPNLLTGERTGLPAPSADGEAAEHTARPLTSERRAELDELAKVMMPDMVALMRESLANANDVSLDVDAREEALLLLHNLVEDIDHARDFKTIGGFPDIVALLACELPPLQAAAAWIIGSAVKNHRELQLHLLERRALPSLLVLLRSSAHVPVRAKALYAASALLRNCAEAQAAFAALDGGGALLDVLANPAADMRLVRKVRLALPKHVPCHEPDAPRPAQPRAMP